jgi:NAD(P)-dependent dehydrogenase (short-subunit alcohol dehydrogenase family)
VAIVTGASRGIGAATARAFVAAGAAVALAARDAAALEAEFTGHGMAPTHISEVTAAFEVAARDRGMSRADHTAARTRIQELLTGAILEARRLDLIIDNELAGDKVIQAVWKQARHVEDPRRPRTAGVPEPPAPATGVDAAPPQPA